MDKITEAANKALRENGYTPLRRIYKCTCPSCGGNVADRAQISDDNKRYAGNVCRNCETAWNVWVIA